MMIPVQKEASAFLYISHTWGYLMGNIQNRLGFSASIGSFSSAIFREGIFVLQTENPINLPANSLMDRVLASLSGKETT